jgi:hypothetical protein
MAYRAKPYFVALDNQQMFRIPAARWHQWALAGLLILVSDRVAKPAAPGVVWLERGELHVKADPIAPWMNLNCRVIERHAIFDTRGPRLDPVKLQRAIQKQYGGRD